MEVALQTLRTEVLIMPDRNVYECDITPIFFENGKFDGFDVQFIQCTNWATLRLDDEVKVCKQALEATYQASMFELQHAQKVFERFGDKHVDGEIASYAKAGIILVREDFPMYRAAKRALDAAREKNILSKDYLELTQGVGKNRIGFNFHNVVPPPAFAQDNNFEMG